MKPVPAETLYVLQEEWRRGLRQVLSGAGPRKQLEGIIHLGNSMVVIFVGDSGVEIPALGSTNAWLQAGGRTLEGLLRIRHDADILTVGHADHRLYLQRMSVSCVNISRQFDGMDSETAFAHAAEAARFGTQRKQIRAAAEQAAKHLSLFYVTAEDLETLCLDTVQRPPAFSHAEPRTLAAIATAWQSLARFSVEPADILNMIHTKMRTAWFEYPKWREEKDRKG